MCQMMPHSAEEILALYIPKYHPPKALNVSRVTTSKALTLTSTSFACGVAAQVPVVSSC
jgi:hypothetical protein